MPRLRILRSSAIALLSLALLLCSGCGDEDDSGDSGDLARVGEACEDSSDCKPGLACLEEEFRCVALCEPGSEECGEGIPCRPAGDVGFCPLPPSGDASERDDET